MADDTRIPKESGDRSTGEARRLPGMTPVWVVRGTVVVIRSMLTGRGEMMLRKRGKSRW